MMSDKATTCHIIAFRSSSSCCTTTTSNDSDSDLPLTSLTHLDGPHYDQCIRDMIDEHIHHHQQQSNQPVDIEEEKKCDDYDYNNNINNSKNNVITIEIHIMGGFNDDDSSSSTITDWLLRLLAQIANEYKNKFEQQQHQVVQPPKVQMVIKTLAVSSSNNQQVPLNNSNNNNNNTVIDSPIGRGLGIDLRSGEVFLAKCNNNTHADTSTSVIGFGSGGPVPILRSVRLWCREQHHHHQLSAVHTVQDVNNLWNSISILDTNNSINNNNNRNQKKIARNDYQLFWVQPIEFNSCNITNFDSLLQLEDDILLQYTSTSPNVEEDGFCEDVRSSLQFLKESKSSQSQYQDQQLKFKQHQHQQEQQHQFFGTNLNRPMVFANRICTTTSTTGGQQQQQQQQWKQLPL